MTEDSKAHKRFPIIDDANVGRFIGEYFGRDAKKADRPSVWRALEAALDRRTGPKCRRVEYDDVDFYQRRGMSKPSSIGRRSCDTSWTALPKKSSRLAREAAERKCKACNGTGEEQGQPSGAPCGAEKCWRFVPGGWFLRDNERSGRDRRKGGK